MARLNLLDLPDDILIDVVDYLDAAFITWQVRESLAHARLTCKRFDLLFTPAAFRRIDAHLYEPVLRAAHTLCTRPHLRAHVRELFVHNHVPRPDDWIDDVDIDPGPRPLTESERQLFSSLHDSLLHESTFGAPALRANGLRDDILEGLRKHSLDALYAVLLLLTPNLRRFEFGVLFDFGVRFATSLMADVLRTRLSISDNSFLALSLMSLSVWDNDFEDWSFLARCPSLQAVDISGCNDFTLRNSDSTFHALTKFEAEYCRVPMIELEVLLQRCPKLVFLSLTKSSVSSSEDHHRERHPICRRQLGNLLRKYRPPLRRLRLHRMTPSQRFFDAHDLPLGDLTSLDTLQELDVDKGDLFGGPQLDVKLADILPWSLRRLYVRHDMYLWHDEHEKLAHEVRYQYECHDLFIDKRLSQLHTVLLERYMHCNPAHRSPIGAVFFRDEHTPSADEREEERSMHYSSLGYLIGFEPSGKVQFYQEEAFKGKIFLGEASWTDWRYPRTIISPSTRGPFKIHRTTWL